MKAVKTFTVRPYLPESLEPLRDLAYNLWWCWQPDAVDLLRRIDRRVWEEVGHNPVALLASVSQERLNFLATDQSFLDHLERVVSAAADYLADTTWFERNNPGCRECLVAYFSLEFGLTEAIPNYSGGLGVLAGDHLKSSSDLGLPLVGVGLLYQDGYFRQYLNADGWQQEEYPKNDFHSLPVQAWLGPDGQQLKVQVSCLGEPVWAAVWKVVVGRVNLLLLDTNLSENSEEARGITAQLYGGDSAMRIRQEIVLGIGGIAAFDLLPFRPTVFHMNEGHSAFLALERIRRIMKASGVSFDVAREAAAVSNVFTTHTPVPAGHDRFDQALMMAHFRDYLTQLGLDEDEFMALGRVNPRDSSEPFCMTVLALRLSAWRNGVSKLHGEVSRELWKGLWPSVPLDEVPIGAITNGVHTPSWISHDLAGLFDRYLGRRWHQEPADAAVWQGGDHIPDTELWRTHERRRERLVAYARTRLRAQLTRRGAPAVEIAQADEVLDPEVLTIGFARRFATYKRSTLLLRDPDRLIRILCNKQRPAQLIFAGKAHPKDSPGKELIREIIHMARRPELRNRIVFIEDYDMAIARYMVQGVDVWLATPRRPLEASGTSGMKAAANGAINCSTLDGWWAEAFVAGETGWAIGRGEDYDDLAYQDEVESHALFDLLEKEIVPLFYDRGADGLPRGWISMMRSAMRTLCPAFASNRMVKEYAETYYLPGLRWYRSLVQDNLAGARELAEWTRRLRAGWPEVRILQVDDDCATTAEVGDQFGVRVTVRLGTLRPSDVRVQLYTGRSDAHGVLTEPRVVEMTCVEPNATGDFGYTGRIPCRSAGPHGYTVRVIPSHPSLINPFDVGLMYWANGTETGECPPQ